MTDDASAASLSFNTPFGQVIHECIVGYCNASLSMIRGGYGLQLFPNIGFRAEACRGTHGLPLEPNADIAGVLYSFFMMVVVVGWIGLMSAGFDIVCYAGEYGFVYLVGCAGSRLSSCDL